MQLDIKEVKVVGGEFRVETHEDNLAVPTADRNSVLTVQCQYGLVGKDGNIVARGLASNVNQSMGTTVMLSVETMAAFSEFNTLLGQDIERGLGRTTEGKPAKGGLADLMAGS